MAHADLPPQPPVAFATHPDRYRHWQLSVDGEIATLSLEVEPWGGLRPDYELKLNSYDLGVDVELADAIRRVRFSHPNVRAVVVTSAVPRVFCAGANIRMLASSAHGFKVNFCKFTNETRCEFEDMSANSGVRFVAAVNGACAGGGYELALACDKIFLIDDGSSTVSLPEVPLLGVLPGTGGLTRLVDKRMIRRDHADLFCTKAEGFRLRDALKMKLVDGGWARSKWDAALTAALTDVVADAQGSLPSNESSPSNEPGDTGSERAGIELTDVACEVTATGRKYASVTVEIEREDRLANITVHAPTLPAPTTHDELLALGDSGWALRAFRELDDALLHLRFNHPNVGLCILRTSGDPSAVLAWDDAITSLRASGSWLAREVQLHQGRVLRRLDNMARSMFALIEPGSCFVGTLFEIALSADRQYMLDDPDQPTHVGIHAVNGGAYTTYNGSTRLQARFLGDPGSLAAALDATGDELDPEAADDLGIITLALDDIDWEDEVRIAIEERVSLSPDALTGMEQNLRFAGAETCDTKVFGRLSAWQNWIFQRPNAVGERGALTMYGHPEKPIFDWQRT